MAFKSSLILNCYTDSGYINAAIKQFIDHIIHYDYMSLIPERRFLRFDFI